MTDEGFARRIWEGYKDLEKREGRRISQQELADRIAKVGGHPTRQDDVSRWFRNAARPEYEELPAIAEVLGMDLMEMTFGKAPQSLLASSRKPRTGLPMDDTEERPLVRPKPKRRRATG